MGVKILSNYFDVYIYDISSLLHNDLFKARSEKVYRCKNYLTFSSQDFLLEQIAGLPRSTIVIDYLLDGYVQTFMRLILKSNVILSVKVFNGIIPRSEVINNAYRFYFFFKTALKKKLLQI